MNAHGTASHDGDTAELEYRGRLQRALGAGYELRQLLGRGGFGAVYVAWDGSLEREIAVKALRHDLFPTRELLDRFQREARAVAKLRHAHILPVYGVGEGEGLAYMMMPVIQGESLRSLLDRGERLSVGEAVRVCTEVARALEAAHRLGIIHRDVKPENILLDGHDRHAMLADFGIAKVAQSESALTASGMIIGSPQYMSPEQAGAESDLDARTDIYSLGCVLYELLAGRRPYEAASFQQLLVRQLTTEPPDIATLVDGLPPAVAAVVMRAIARDRTKRWPTAESMAIALQQSTSPAVSTRAVGDSWLARRGLLLVGTFLLFAYVYFTAQLFYMVMTGNRQATLIISMFHEPLAWSFRLVLIALGIEATYTVVSSRVSGASWGETMRRLLGQPRWWQAWYPRSLRDPENVWDRMPALMRADRTLVAALLFAIPLSLPLEFVAPTLSTVAASAGLALPVPMRLMLGMSGALRTPIIAGAILAPLLLFWLSMRRQVPIRELLPLLFTWRASRWSTPAGRKLLD